MNQAYIITIPKVDLGEVEKLSCLQEFRDTRILLTVNKGQLYVLQNVRDTLFNLLNLNTGQRLHQTTAKYSVETFDCFRLSSGDLQTVLLSSGGAVSQLHLKKEVTPSNACMD